MGFNEFLSKLFGNKATRDMKEIVPWVEKVKAAYPAISQLTTNCVQKQRNCNNTSRTQPLNNVLKSKN